MGLILYTERQPAFKSWDTGRIWVSSNIPNAFLLLSHVITAEFGFVLIYEFQRIPSDNGRIWVSSYIPNAIRLLSHLG